MMKLSLLLCAFATSLLAGENLIENPDFELNPGTGLPKMWGLSRNAAGEVLPLPSGKNALRVSGPGAGMKYWWIQHLGKIAPGKHYRLTGKVKGDSGIQATVYVECNNPWKTVSSGPIDCNGQWKSVNLEFQFSSLKNPPYLVLRTAAPGGALFTDLKIEEINQVSINLLRNPAFSESGTKGMPRHWTLSKGATGERVTDGKSGFFRLNGAGEGKTAFITQHSIPVKPNGEYQLSVEFRGTGNAVFSAYLESNRPWQTCASPARKCTDQWQTLKWNFKFKEYQNAPYLVFRIKGAGTLDIRAPELLQTGKIFGNGDFTDGAKEWKITSGRIVDSRSGHGNVLELASDTKTEAKACQEGITLKGGQFYQLRYEVRGGTDRTHRDAQGAVWFRVVPVIDGKIISGTETWLDSFDSWQTKTVVFKAEKDCSAAIVCEAKTPGCVWFDGIQLDILREVPPPLTVLLNAPFSFRNGVYSSNRKISTFSGEVRADTLPSLREIRLVFQNRETTLKKSSGVYPFTLETPQKHGEYPIKIRALDDSGREIAAATLPFQVNPPSEREVTFTDDQVMLIDGNPFFPLGVWSVDGKKSPAEKAAILARNGFNTARCDGDLMDDFASAGMMVLMKVPEKLPSFADPAHFARWDSMYRKRMEKYLRHPSLIGYYNSDEPAWRGAESRPILEAYNYIRKLDPYRPIMLNEAPRGTVTSLRPYAAACDTYGIDIYPIPSPNPHSGLADKTMTSVGKYTEFCREVVQNRKPVWMTLQGFAWGMVTGKKPFVFPTHEENRFMAYNAIAHGATGLFWWGINWNDHENWEFLDELGKTVRELRAMSPVFVAEAVSPSALAAEHPDLKVLHKKRGQENWYIVLNESPQPVQGSFRLNHAGTLKVFFENRTIPCRNGAFTDTFAAYAVHIYSDASELPPPLPIPATRRIFGKPFSSGNDFKHASWIWFPGKSNTPKHRAYFRREIDLRELPDQAELSATADDVFQASINGRIVMEHYQNRGYSCVSVRDITPFLRKGKNLLEIKACDAGTAPCALLYALRLTDGNRNVTRIVSDADTMTSEDGKNWSRAEVIGKYGCPPWLSRSTAQPADTAAIGAFGFPF